MDISKYLKDETAVFPFAPGVAATITVRLLTPGDEQDAADAGFVKRYVMEGEGEDARMVPVLEARAREPRDLRLQRMVAGWEGVTDGGEALECTPENVVAVARALPGWLEHVQAMHARLAADVAARRGAEAGN